MVLVAAMGAGRRPSLRSVLLGQGLHMSTVKFILGEEKYECPTLSTHTIRKGESKGYRVDLANLVLQRSQP